MNNEAHGQTLFREKITWNTKPELGYPHQAPLLRVQGTLWKKKQKEHKRHDTMKADISKSTKTKTNQANKKELCKLLYTHKLKENRIN